MRPTLLALAAIVVALSALPSPAQPMRFGGGMGEMLQPAFSTRDMERYADFLNLTPEQRDAAKALVEGYQSEYERIAREMRDASDAAREEFRDTRDFTVWDDLRPKFEAFQKRRRELEQSLFNDVKVLLTDDQTSRWPALERLRRRDQSLRRGFLSGEAVDVIRLFDDLKPPPELRDRAKPILDQYEMEIDRALVERDERYEDGFSRGMDLWRAGDLAAVADVFNKAREAAVNVRDANRRYARQVEAVLPDDLRESFSRQFLERSFPRVYRPSDAQRALDAAAAFNDLSPDQRAALAELRASYSRELQSANRRWADAIEQQELTITPMDLMRGGGNPAVRDARVARRDLDRRTLDKLRALLSEDQSARLPEPRRGGDDAGFMP